MRLAFFLCSRSWTSRRIRFLCSTLGVALGIGLVVAIVTVDRNAVLHKQRKGMRDYGRPDLELRGDWEEPGDAAEVLSRVRAVAGVQAATPLASRRATLSAGERRQRVRWFQMPPGDVAAFEAFSHQSGARFAEGTQPGDLWITARLSRDLDVAVGAMVELDGASYRVAGLMDSRHLAAQDEGEVVLSDFPAPGTDAVAHGTATLMIWVKLDEPARRDEFLGRFAATGLLAQPPPYERITATAEDIAMRNGLKICALLSLFLGLFIVFHTLLMTVSQRRQEISLLHALGATRRQIGHAFLLESVLQSVLGAAAGVVLGIALAWIMGLVGISSMGAARYPIVDIPWPEILAISCGGWLLTVLGALYPVFMSARVPTAEVLHPTGLSLEDLRPSPLRWVLPLVFGAALLLVQLFMSWLIDAEAARLAGAALQIAALLAVSVSLVFVLPRVVHGIAGVVGRLLPAVLGVRYYLSYRNVAASGHRNASAVCALMLVFASIFSMHTLTESLKDEVRVWARDAVHGRVFVDTRVAARPVDRRPLRDLPGVAAVLAVENEVHLPRTIRGIDFSELVAADLPESSLPDADREALQRLVREEGIIVTTAFAARAGVEAGDTLRLSTREGEVPLEVLRVTDRYGYQRPERDYALLAPSLLERWFGARRGYTTAYVLHLEPDADGETLREPLYAAFPTRPRVLTGEQMFTNRVRNIDFDFLVFDVVLLGALVLSGIAMFNSLMIRALHRRREIALYRALGMTPPQLIAGMTGEGIVLGLTGAVLALLLGLPCSYLGYQALREVSGLTLRYDYPVGWAAVCLVLCVLVAYLASRYPARRLAAADVASSLQY